MIPKINKPTRVTRVTRHTVAAIDHIFIEIKTAIVITDIPNHFPIIFATKNKIDAEIPEQHIFIRNISDQSIDKFKQKLCIIDSNNIKIMHYRFEQYQNYASSIRAISKLCIIDSNNIKIMHHQFEQYQNYALSIRTISKLCIIDSNNIKILQNINDPYSKFLELFLSLYNKRFLKIKVKFKPQRLFNP